MKENEDFIRSVNRCRRGQFRKKRKNIQGRLKGPAAGRLPSAVMIRRPGAFFDAERY